MAAPIISSDRWISHVLEKMDIDPSRVSRVVIDAKAGGILTLYIAYYGGPELLDVIPVKIVECNQP